MLLMGKSTISMAIFNSYVTNYQRVIRGGGNGYFFMVFIRVNNGFFEW